VIARKIVTIPTNHARAAGEIVQFFLSEKKPYPVIDNRLISPISLVFAIGAFKNLQTCGILLVDTSRERQEFGDPHPRAA
jgi:hypothetical protein